MTKEEVRELIEKTGILPAIRVASAEDALFAASAVYRGGIVVVELTMTVPGAIGVIQELGRMHPKLVVGAGTVLDVESSLRCVAAGAAFITSPGLDCGIVEFAKKQEVAVIPGALSPTEVMKAHKTGADLIKIFPCAQVGGPAYIKALKAPFPGISFVASGGVNQVTAHDFIRAGACALGIRQELIPPQAIARRNEDWILELTNRFLGIVAKARAEMQE
jgi:2-dehydro-3-deoxyphosphogluconate aldolase/(4S)-4-hydroxy-2-oxoglutarate aldolase